MKTPCFFLNISIKKNYIAPRYGDQYDFLIEKKKTLLKIEDKTDGFVVQLIINAPFVNSCHSCKPLYKNATSELLCKWNMLF